MHNCIEKLREKIMKNDPEINYIIFDLSRIQSFDRDKGIESDYKTGQAIEMGYNHIKRDGTKVKKSRKTFVTHTYCPFCGKKY